MKTLYRFLTDNDREILHSALVAAFSDYQVDMRMSREQFDYRLLRDGIDLSKSVGAFKEDVLIGFCISGVGMWQDEKTIYDAGTGVVRNIDDTESAGRCSTSCCRY